MSKNEIKTNGPLSMDRRYFLKVTGAGAVTMSALGGASLMSPANASVASGSVTWISPRGTLEVMDDYPYWIGKELGYFDGLDTKLEPGPSDGTATVKFVALSQADMGYPSPGVFSFAIENDMDLLSVFNMGAVDVFDFAFRPGEGFTDLKNLEGKTILLGSAAWQAITDPMLAAAGVDISKVTYLEGGWPQWGTLLTQGQGDAALAWEGLRADWQGKGLELEYWRGADFSNFPANSFVVRRADVEDDASRAVLEKYLRGWAMGLEFGHINPRGAADAVFKEFPELKRTVGTDLGVEQLVQLARVFRGNMEEREGWGWHDFAKWELFFKTLADIGQTKSLVDASTYLTNDLIGPANDFDKAKVAADAEAYELSEDVAAVDMAAIEGRFLDNVIR